MEFVHTCTVANFDAHGGLFGISNVPPNLFSNCLSLVQINTFQNIWIRFAILWSCGLWTEKNLNVSSEIVSWLTGQLTGVSQFAAHLGKYASPTLQYAHCTLYIAVCTMQHLALHFTVLLCIIMQIFPLHCSALHWMCNVSYLTQIPPGLQYSGEALLQCGNVAVHQLACELQHGAGQGDEQQRGRLVLSWEKFQTCRQKLPQKIHVMYDFNRHR